MSTLTFTPGQSYVTRNGARMLCVGRSRKFIVFESDQGFLYSYTPEGTYSHQQPQLDLISEWIYRPEVDWQKYPAWLPWLAMDKDGRWFLYEKEPRTARGEDAWVRDSMGDLLLRIPPEYAPSFSGNWQDSLCSREGK